MFFRFHLLEQNVEALEIFLPNLAVAVGPGRDLLQGLGLESAEILATVAAALDHAGVLEVSEVLGDGLLGHGERSREFVHRCGPAGEPVDDGAPGRVAEGGEHGAEFIHNHMVVYNCRAVKRDLFQNAVAEATAADVASNMTIADRIEADLKDAMRAKNADKLSVLRMLKSALKNVAIEKGGASTALDEAETTQVIRKQVKQRQDSIEQFEKGGRPELAAKEKGEIAVLNAYLPQAMSAEELQKLVAATIAETGATSRAQMGAVMKALGAKVAGRADGKSLSAEVQRQLSA